jgi:hypothetical protein
MFQPHLFQYLLPIHWFLVLSSRVFQVVAGLSQEALWVQLLPHEGLPAEAPVGPPVFPGGLDWRPAAPKITGTHLFRRFSECVFFGIGICKRRETAISQTQTSSEVFQGVHHDYHDFKPKKHLGKFWKVVFLEASMLKPENWRNGQVRQLGNLGNPRTKWSFLAGKIIYGLFSMPDCRVPLRTWWKSVGLDVQIRTSCSMSPQEIMEGTTWSTQVPHLGTNLGFNPCDSTRKITSFNEVNRTPWISMDHNIFNQRANYHFWMGNIN